MRVGPGADAEPALPLLLPLLLAAPLPLDVMRALPLSETQTEDEVVIKREPLNRGVPVPLRLAEGEPVTEPLAASLLTGLRVAVGFEEGVARALSLSPPEGDGRAPEALACADPELDARAGALREKLALALELPQALPELLRSGVRDGEDRAVPLRDAEGQPL